jgi:hypothetical protein
MKRRIKLSGSQGSGLRRTAVARCALLALMAMTSSFAACGACPPTYDFQRNSPSSAYVVASYSYLCGPTPFNTRLGLRRSAESQFKDVVTILEAPFEADATWRDDKTLHVTFDCPKDTRAACAPPTDRNWELLVNRHWEDVDIEFSIGQRLRSMLNADALARFPR